jgi:hypothetical protein
LPSLTHSLPARHRSTVRRSGMMYGTPLPDRWSRRVEREHHARRVVQASAVFVNPPRPHRGFGHLPATMARSLPPFCGERTSRESEQAG